MDFAEIQHAIEELPKEQQTALAAWLAERDQAEWESDIERDFAPGGAGVTFLEEDEGERARRASSARLSKAGPKPLKG